MSDLMWIAGWCYEVRYAVDYLKAAIIGREGGYHVKMYHYVFL